MRRGRRCQQRGRRRGRWRGQWRFRRRRGSYWCRSGWWRSGWVNRPAEKTGIGPQARRAEVARAIQPGRARAGRVGCGNSSTVCPTVTQATIGATAARARCRRGEDKNVNTLKLFGPVCRSKGSVCEAPFT